ncbi:MAG: hypothetical protein ABI333_03025 [bacterium]
MDAGNLLLYRKHFRAGQAADEATLKRRTARAAAIAQVYAQMKFHGVALGATDLVLGLPALRALEREHRLPLLSANLQSTAGKRLFKANRLVTLGGVKFGIFGLTGEQNIARVKIDPAQFKLADPVKAAQAQVQELRKAGAQIVVALAAVGHQQARQVAEGVKGIDFMFVSGTGRHMDKAERVGTAWVTEMGREGKYIGHLSLYVRRGDLTFEDLSERYQLAQRIDQLHKSLAGLRARMSQAEQSGRGDFLRRRLQTSESSIQRMQVQLHKANRVQPKGSFFTGVMTPVAMTLPQDPSVKALLAKATQAAGLKRPPGTH